MLATSGIGAAFAEKYASIGYDLIITGRREEKINKFAIYLSNTYDVNVDVMIIELSRNDEIDRLVEKVKDKNIDVLINNAGFGIKNYYDNIHYNVWKSMANVHVICPMKLIYAVLQNMK